MVQETDEFSEESSDGNDVEAASENIRQANLMSTRTVRTKLKTHFDIIYQKIYDL